MIFKLLYLSFDFVAHFSVKLHFFHGELELQQHLPSKLHTSRRKRAEFHFTGKITIFTSLKRCQ